MSRENVEVAKRYFEAFNAHGLEGTRHLRHPDWELFDLPELPDADRHIGEQSERRVESFTEVGWDRQFRVQEFIDAGEEVIVVYRTTAQAPLGGIHMDTTWAFVCLFEGGKLRRVRQYLTKEQALEAVGLRDG